MNSFWKSDPCYAELGVDGSKCSIMFYLSELEQHCPPFSWRSASPAAMYPQANLNELFVLMKDNPNNYLWIQSRISRMWSKWQHAFDDMVAKNRRMMGSRPKLKILLHLGFLTKESGFKFGLKSVLGGPLGELVQWSDLIATLFILGHKLMVSTEIESFIIFIKNNQAHKNKCQIGRQNGHIDLIYTDIVGLLQMRKKISTSLNDYRCKLRILDSFGTQAEFNDPEYFSKHKSQFGKKTGNPWGGLGLNLKQFLTMFPHSPDNSFLGFVVEMHPNNMNDKNRHKWALVYGKEAYMWKDAFSYLKLIQSITQVHSTVNSNETLMSGVVNHGVLTGEQFHSLLRQVKVFIGLGFPYEGPAPLEAVANGAIFINPRFIPPKNRRTEQFFAEKPTLRSLTSQSPYAEEFIGFPNVITVDINNDSAVLEAVRMAMRIKTVPYLPYEFTAGGMLERVNAYVLNQDWCTVKMQHDWPPFSSSQLVLAHFGLSCQSACSNRGQSSVNLRICAMLLEMVLHEDGAGPLHFLAGAFNQHSYSAALILLRSGCNPNARTIDGVTPVHISAEWSQYEQLDLLLRYGGDPELITNEGFTAFDMARKQNDSHCLRLLNDWRMNKSKRDKLTHQEESKSVNCGHFHLSEFHLNKATSLRSSLAFDEANSPERFPIIDEKYSSAKKCDEMTHSPEQSLIYKTIGIPEQSLCYKTVDNAEQSFLNEASNSEHEATSPRISPVRVEKTTLLRTAFVPSLNYDAISEDNSSIYSNSNQGRYAVYKTPTKFGPTNRRHQHRNPAKLLFPCCSPESQSGPISPSYGRSELEKREGNESPTANLNRLCSQLTLTGTTMTENELETTLREELREEQQRVDVQLLAEIQNLDDATLRRRLTKKGIAVGPILPHTRSLYIRRLACLLTDEKQLEGRNGNMEQMKSKPAGKRFSLELETALNGRMAVDEASNDCKSLVQFFEESSMKGRPWREGIQKMSFCYLLIDPTGLNITTGDDNYSIRFSRFVDAIFYVGKGKRTRPYQHLTEAAVFRHRPGNSGQISAKTRRILDLWSLGYGVISLHIFQNVIPVEALCREAAMIDTIGLSNLANVRKGEYYGMTLGWTVKRRRSFGAFLLMQAMSILNVEGARQLYPDDVS